MDDIIYVDLDTNQVVDSQQYIEAVEAIRLANEIQPFELPIQNSANLSIRNPLEDITNTR